MQVQAPASFSFQAEMCHTLVQGLISRAATLLEFLWARLQICASPWGSKHVAHKTNVEFARHSSCDGVGSGRNRMRGILCQPDFVVSDDRPAISDHYCKSDPDATNGCHGHLQRRVYQEPDIEGDLEFSDPGLRYHQHERVDNSSQDGDGGLYIADQCRLRNCHSCHHHSHGD